jgi:hypothetical protein
MLSDTHIGNRDVERIAAEMPSLESIILSGTAVDDTGISHLAKLRRLTSVELDSTRITGESIMRLSACSALSNLSIRDTDVSHAAISRFRERRPSVYIDQRPFPRVWVKPDL